MKNLVIMLKSSADEPNTNILPDCANAYIGYCYNRALDEDTGKICTKCTFSDYCGTDPDKLEFTEEKVKSHCNNMQAKQLEVHDDARKQITEDYLNPNLGNVLKQALEVYTLSEYSKDVWVVVDNICYPINEWYRHLAREYNKDSNQKFTYYIGTVWEFYK